MKRHAILALFSLLLLGGLMACAPQPSALPTKTQSGYTVSLETRPDVVWLKGPVSNQPNNLLGLGGLIVRVHDAQGHPVEGIPVSFNVEPSWSEDVSMWTDPATAEDGRARAIIEPHYAGTLKVHIRVQDVLKTATIRVELQTFGNSTAHPSLVGLSLPL